MIDYKTTVFIENNKYLLKDKIFESFDIEHLQKQIKNNLKIIILGENLWIKKMECENKNYEKFIEEEIKLLNDPNGDLLYHNQKDKKNKRVFIYSIKGKKLVEKIIINKKNIEIIPIQFLILNKLLKNNRGLSYLTVIVRVKMCYYIISVNNEIIINSYIVNSEELKDKSSEVLSKLNKENVIIDSSVSEDIKLILNEEHINFKQLKGRLCENL